MNLTAVSFGSRGDVEPFVALGAALTQAGHRVRLLTHPEYATLAPRTGIEIVGARGRSTRELIESDEGRAVLRKVRNPFVMMRRIAEVIAPELELIYEDTLRAAADADALLAFPSTFPALDVAEHLRLPIVHVHHVPLVPTRSFPAPAPYVTTRTLTPLGNRASYTLDAWLLWRLTRDATSHVRAQVLGRPGGGRSSGVGHYGDGRSSDGLSRGVGRYGDGRSSDGLSRDGRSGVGHPSGGRCDGMGRSGSRGRSDDGRQSASAALAQRRRRAGAIVAVSPHVLPPPRDWPRDVVACGYFWAARTSEAAQTGEAAPTEAAPTREATRTGEAPQTGEAAVKPLDEETEEFLASGPPPVFLSLGSTPLRDPEQTTRQVVDAARKAGLRLVLQRGWAGLGESMICDRSVHLVGDVPYDALFPRVVGVAHHGGAGTTALGLRYGCPTVCLPAVADQFFWGHRVAALRVGPRPLPVRRLRRDRLADKLVALAHNRGYRAQARRLREALAQEDGCATAAAAVERFLAKSETSSRTAA